MGAELLEKAKNSRQEEITKAENKIAEYSCVKNSLTTVIAEGKQKLEKAADIINEHARNEQRPESILT